MNNIGAKMDENIIPTEDQIESGESRGAEQESLDDATFEPSSHVEQTGDYEQSETVQTAFETVTSQQESSPESAPAETLSDGKSKGTFKDPLTGKDYGGEDNSTGSSSDEDEPVVAEQNDKEIEATSQAEEVTTSKAEGREPSMASTDVINGNEPAYQMEDTDKTAGQKIGAGVQQPSDQSKDIEPPGLS